MIVEHNYAIPNHNEEFEKLRLAIDKFKEWLEMSWKERLEQELEQLQNKIKFLEKELEDGKVSEQEKKLVKNQIKSMFVQAMIIDERIKLRE